MPRQKSNPDLTWKYPHLTRLQVANLRIYFSHFATRIRGWHQQKNEDTHALPKEMRGKDGPWSSVPPQHRPRVEAWFQKKLMELKAKGITPTPGKIRSLRCNAANYGRYVLTGLRRANRSAYERRKKQWLAYLDWEREQQRKELVASRGPTPHRVLEIG